MKKALSLALLLVITAGSAQAKISKKETLKASYSVSCVAFYNLENLFDTINDPTINDEEYLPEGGMKWTSFKYENKVQKMAYALSQLGTDYVPTGAAVIGVSEIENRGVLEDVVADPAWGERKMEIVHYDGPDRRGVDVGLLYNPDYFTVTNSNSHRLYIEEDPNFRTRDQLVVSGYLQGEKIHVIVNHWPSRYGGEVASRPKRAAAARLTKWIADSIYQREPKAKIIIMGDLNDDPYNIPCCEVLGAKKTREEVQPQGFFNTMWQMLDRGIGSLAYNGSWNLFDQIIISEPLMNANPAKELSYWKAQVFNKPFLTVQEGKDKGTPLRTTKSNVWQNGYSDHYPTMIYLIKQKQ